jgi:hypothetical protein
VQAAEKSGTLLLTSSDTVLLPEVCCLCVWDSV